MNPFRLTDLASGGRIDRHRHDAPYATVLLEGSYEEAGDAGRHMAVAGECLLHAPFSCHQNRVSAARTRVLDLPLPLEARRLPARAALADPDELVKLSERDGRAAVECLLERLQPIEPVPATAADRLSEALRRPGGDAIGEWAQREGLSREHVSRQFRSAFGVTAATYRLENLARQAWFALVESEEPLAMIAAETGFADQAHMSRAVLALTRRTPGQWRAWSRERIALAA